MCKGPEVWSVFCVSCLAETRLLVFTQVDRHGSSIMTIVLSLLLWPPKPLACLSLVNPHLCGLA